MSRVDNKINSNRLRSSNITVVISISLVLFLIGLFGIIILNAQKYSEYIKEQLVMEIYMKKAYDKRDIKTEEERHLKLLDSIRQLPYVAKAKYIDKETATEIAKKDLGVDTKNGLFEEDIFPPSIEISLKSDYVIPAKVDTIAQELSTIKLVDEVKNDQELMIEVYENISKITLWIIGFAVLFTIIAVILINNSIRLKIYAKRFIIKTMQLVGAKRRFILMPFIKEAFVLGLIGCILSLSVLFGLWYYLSIKIHQPIDVDQLLIVAGVVFTIGILITVGSTLVATWKFLQLRRDELYYS
ncbi:MAG: FtsX-like permease family protein [Flavobacteriales bacterium]|nr:FtsX-like permease family protein [Flavobacteriales bacterium]